ncbi:DUF4097 family beta strand repeat-containing protein [Actinomycetaceae bacterium L2_0104]
MENQTNGARSGSYPVGYEPFELELESQLGDVDIVVVPESDEIRWSLEGSDAAAAKVEVSFEGNVLRVCSGQRRKLNVLGYIVNSLSSNDSVDIRLTLPQNLKNATIKIEMGDLRIHGAAFGPATISSGKGNVEIESFANAEMALAAGFTRVPSGGEAGSVKTGLGHVFIGVGSGARLESGVGNVQVDHLIGDAWMKAGTGDIIVKKMAWGELDANAGVGDVKIGVPRGTAALLDCTSGLGEVKSELRGGGEPEPDAPHVAIRGKSGVGNVSIRYA